MKTITWDDAVQMFGEDLSLFTVSLASRAAADIVDGFMKMAKGARFLEQQTMNAMASDIADGIVIETLNRHLEQAGMETVASSDEMLTQGMAALDRFNQEAQGWMTEAYYAYLSEWDLEGHNWTKESPQSYQDFLSSRSAA